MKLNKLEDIWKKIDIKGEDECWEFIGYKIKQDMEGLQ